MADDNSSEAGISESGPFFAELTIKNKKGLHARASARFVKCAEQYDAEVFVTRSGETVGGTSIMGLMMLAACQGSTILVETRGAEADLALKALVDLVEARFHEEG